MQTLYTHDIRVFLNSRDWPKGLEIDVREESWPEPHLNLIFFRDNWLTLDFDAQSKVTSLVKEVMEKLWEQGVPTYVGKMESRNEA